MTRSPTFRRTAALLAAVPLLWLLPPSGWSQDLQFDEEDTVIDSDEFLIPEDEAPVFDSGEAGAARTTGLVIPGDYLDAGTAELISDLIIDELANIPDVAPVDYLALRDEFDIMGAELAVECAYDPVCLGRVGEDVGLDEIIIGRATGRSGGEIQLVLDRINTEDRSVVRYRNVRTDDDIASLEAMVESQLPYLYGMLTEEPDNRIVGPTGPSKFQVAMSWTTLGLGVVALGVGLAFGIKANSGENDVRDATILESGARDLTQVEADQMLADAEDDALISNIMLGTGIALIGVSVLLFLITPGSDIDAEADDQYTRSEDFAPRVGATVTEDGWGVFGRVRF